MAVVDDGEGAGLIVELDARRVERGGRGDVYRRLFVAVGAGGVAGAEVAPVVGAGFAAVAPVGVGGGPGDVAADWAECEAQDQY